MFREYRIMRDLKPAFDQVPQTVFYTDDESVSSARNSTSWTGSKVR